MGFKFIFDQVLCNYTLGDDQNNTRRTLSGAELSGAEICTIHYKIFLLESAFSKHRDMCLSSKVADERPSQFTQSTLCLPWASQLMFSFVLFGSTSLHQLALLRILNKMQQAMAPMPLKASRLIKGG